MSPPPLSTLHGTDKMSPPLSTLHGTDKMYHQGRIQENKLRGINAALTSCEACTADRKAIRLGFGGVLNMSEHV